MHNFHGQWLIEGGAQKKIKNDVAQRARPPASMTEKQSKSQLSKQGNGSCERLRCPEKKAISAAQNTASNALFSTTLWSVERNYIKISIGISGVKSSGVVDQQDRQPSREFQVPLPFCFDQLHSSMDPKVLSLAPYFLLISKPISSIRRSTTYTIVY